MNTQGFPLVIARVLLALMFLMSGISKLTGLEGTAGYIASVGLPAPTLLALGAGVVELVGGVLLVIGWQARWAALALAAFTLLASVLFHNFWAMPADKAFMQQLMFLKNLSVVGGLLFVFAYGAGTASLDSRRGAVAA
jgi:putative oxidoreductase